MMKIVRKIDLILVILLVTLIPLLFVPVPIWLLTPAGNAFTDFGHIIFFGALTFLAYRQMPFSPTINSILILLAAFIGGVTIEILQDFVGRDSSWSDVFKNMLATLFVLSWLNKARLVIWIGRVITSLLVFLNLVFLIVITINQHKVFQEFPVLSNFESGYDFQRWKGTTKRVKSFKSQGQYGMQVKFRENRYSRFEIANFPRNWSDFSNLCFDIYNPDDDSLPLTIRINDYKYNRRRNDRYQQPLLVKPSWNYICIPLEEIKNGPSNRELELNAVRRIVVFAYQLETTRTIYTDNWRLQ